MGSNRRLVRRPGSTRLRFGRATIVTVCFALVASVLVSVAGAAYGDGTTATPAITIAETADGQPPFDPTAGPGNDTGPNNGVVRTDQLITYSVAMSINDPSAPSQTTFQHTTATFQPLPLGFVWNSIPLECTGSNTSLTGDGVSTPSVLVCDFGAKATGSTWTMTPSILALRTAVSGTTVAPSATLSATGMVQTATGAATGVAVSVSAAPKAGVTKGNPIGPQADVLNGQPASRFFWPFGIHIDDGSDIINGNSFSFTDDLSSLPAGATFEGCAQNTFDSIPASFTYNPGGGPLAGVPNNGGATWTCTQDPVNPQLVHVTVTGVNTNPASANCPVYGGDDVTSIPSDICYVSTWGIKITIPNSSLGTNGASGTNWVSQLSATDLAGNPNYGGNPDPGTGMDNNQVASTSYLVGRQHGWTSILRSPPQSGASPFLLYKSDYRTTGSGGSITGVAVGTNQWSGDGSITQGGTYASRNALFFGGLMDLPAGFIMCATIDNAHDIIGTLGGSIQNAATTGSSSLNAAGMWSVQFGTGGNGGVNSGDGTGWSSYTAQQQGSCTDADSPSWYSSVSQVPGGAGAVTKVRFVLNQTITVAQQIDAINANQSELDGWVALQVRSTTTNGTIVPNYGWATNDPGAVTATNPNGTVTSSYNYATAANGGFGDRITVTGVRVLVSKTAAQAQYLAGQTASFTLAPSTDPIGGTPAPQALNVALTDTLPAGLSYVGGSAVGSTNYSASCSTTSCAPTSVTVNPDGTTTLVWTLGSSVAGAALPKITYKALISSSSPGGSNYVNTVVASADNDTSPASYRTSTATINITGGAQFAVAKSSPQPLTEPGTPKQFSITFQNNSSQTYPGTDFIDWLPFNGDQRAPASAIQGTSTLAGAPVDSVGGPSMSFEYSSYPTSSLVFPADADPATANPAIQWCTQAQFGTAGCPASFAAVTGVQMIGSQIGPNVSDTVTYSLNVSGDVAGNVFSNQLTGEVSGIGLPISSNTATVRTVLGSISGTVWNDTSNKNGLIDAAEPDLSGVTVQLLDAGGTVIATKTTDSSGHYTFPNLVHGTYSVHVVQPNGMSTTLPLQGTDPTINSKIHYGTNTTDPITLTIGQNQLNVNAGFFTYTPAIDVVKTINGQHVPDPANPVLVATGSTMQFAFVVTNKGNVTLNPVTVSDDVVTGISCPQTSLAVGATMTCTATAPAPSTPGATHADHVTATGTGVGLNGAVLTDGSGNPVPPVTATDQAHAFTPDPHVLIVKKINGSDANTAPGVLVPTGSSMAVTFEVTNAGNVPLSAVSIADDTVPTSGISCPQTTLAVGETITCSATWPAPAPGIQHTDIATVTATPPVTSDGTVLPNVSDTDSANAYTEPAPAISVVKTINGASASHTQPGVGVVASSQMQVRFDVTNTGDVRLDPVNVADSDIAAAGISCPATALDPGATMTCTATNVAPGPGGTHHDTATATGTAAYPSGTPMVDLATGDPVGNVTNTADAYAVALTPGIGVVKKINGQIAQSQAFAVPVTAKDDMQVAFDVSNTGQAALQDVTVSDNVIAASAISCPQTTLAVGETMTCTATWPGPAAGGIHHDTVTVSGQPLGPDGSVQGDPVSAQTDAWAIAEQPAIEIVKSIDGADANTAETAVTVAPDKLMNITFKVTNTGNVTLDHVSVSDDVVAASAIACPKTTLAAGESMVCTATLAPPSPGQLHHDTATVTGTPPATLTTPNPTPVTATDAAFARTQPRVAVTVDVTVTLGTHTSSSVGSPGAHLSDIVTISGLGHDYTGTGSATLYGPYAKASQATCQPGKAVATVAFTPHSGVNKTPYVPVTKPGYYTWVAHTTQDLKYAAATHPCGLKSETTLIHKPDYPAPLVPTGYNGTQGPSSTRTGHPAHLRAGHPGGARLQFGAVGANAPTTQVSVLNGIMTIPSDPNVLGSLDQSAAIDDLIGTTVIAGHVSDRDDKPGAFYNLTRAKRGDVITYVTAQGRRLRFKVTMTATYSRSGRLPASLFQTTGPHRLVLISCTGEKVYPDGHFHYTRNIVVVATPIP